MLRRFVIPIIVFALLVSGCGPATTNDTVSAVPIPEAPTQQVEETGVQQPQTGTMPVIVVPDGIPTPPLEKLPDGTPIAPTGYEQDGEVQLWNLSDKKVSVSDIFHPSSPAVLGAEVLTLSAADGPLPVGEILALLLLAGTLYYVSTQPMPQIDISTWSNPPAPMPMPMPSMEIPQVYLQNLKDFQPKTGVSRGTDQTKYSTTMWLIVSMPTYCTIWFSASMPKDDWSKLLEFTHEEKNDGNPCNIFAIIQAMLKLGKKAMEAGAGMEFIKRFYLEVFSKVVVDFKVPLDGDFIIKMLGL